ncbi:uncharacterized protein LOC136086170 [Hydra vulgaris]|uniref:Uncharacterized protein LOC136086170 n=1 Tax=Hydra vulgaris TaxID=6087 RepID=A0ABM4CRL5_HYDVU
MGCTTDVTHQEQLNLVLRIYNCKLFAVEEHFIGFVGVNRTTREVLTETFLKHLTEAGLVQTLTLKPLPDTRWESRVESLKTLKYEYSKVYDALVEIANSSECDTSSKFQANNLAKQMSKFTFMVSLSVWYNILFQVNLVSKKMQSPDYDLSTAQTEIDQLK